MDTNKTNTNMWAAFAGESQANRKYTAFARKAEEEGYPQVARLFRAIAAAETVHAINHFRALGEVKSTTDNLKAAMAGEHYEVNTMYPEFIQAAQADGEKRAERSMNWAWEVEKIHEVMYQQALETLGKASEAFDYYICPVCGHTAERGAPDKCPICGTPGSRYEKIS
jgi:rubrerythrin